MISKESFVSIMEALDEFWNDKVEHLKALDIHESYFTNFTDKIIAALEEDIDPKKTARNDEYCYDCGTYICEWLFGEGEFQEKCKTAAELYEYIVAAQIRQVENA
jgi:hypothetical protein